MISIRKLIISSFGSLIILSVISCTQKSNDAFSEYEPT
jgi:hypothetical protein